MATVTLQHVSKDFPGGVRAVTDFCLEIADGEFVVLVGPSGCGKSTTLRMIAGLEDVSAGVIAIGGQDVTAVAPQHRDIAMVFQSYALYPHMTVFGNLAFSLKLRKLPKAEIQARVAAVAELLGLEALLERKPRALSGGQCQRVALGRAIVREPAVFLFDEPLSNLDAKLRGQMRVELKRLHARLGATMIYVTHDQAEAMTMGDRIVVMRDGLIQQVAAPLTVYDRPANTFVAGFIGTPPMNLFAGQVIADGAGLVFGERDGGFRLPLTADQQAAAAALVGQPATLGIRPEDIGSPAARQTAAAPVITATVDVVEPLGAECCVYLDTGHHPLVARLDAHTRVVPGEVLALPVCMARAHLFDAAGELVV